VEDEPLRLHRCVIGCYRYPGMDPGPGDVACRNSVHPCRHWRRRCGTRCGHFETGCVTDRVQRSIGRFLDVRRRIVRWTSDASEDVAPHGTALTVRRIAVQKTSWIAK